MVRPTGVIRGFTKLAVEMLRDDPSRTWTAEELAAEALRRDPTLSVAKNPLVSLAATFAKEIQGPVTVENLNTGIGILQRIKEKLTT